MKNIFRFHATLLLAPLALFAADTAKQNGVTDPSANKPPVYAGSAEVTAKAKAYRFTSDPKLPNILLLGDSISIGYTLAVRQNLKGVANVCRPMQEDGTPRNCGGTHVWVKGNLEQWLKARPKWDVIHFNAGLHDVARIEGSKKEPERAIAPAPQIPNQVPLETYQKNLEQIVGALKATGARLIFATTTPTPPSWRLRMWSPTMPPPWPSCGSTALRLTTSMQRCCPAWPNCKSRTTATSRTRGACFSARKWPTPSKGAPRRFGDPSQAEIVLRSVYDKVLTSCVIPV